jgi:LPS export ABC transporter protein LptC
MHLTRKQSIKLTIIILVLFFTLSIISIKLNEEKVEVVENILKNEIGLDGVSIKSNAQIVLDDFTRSSMKNGEKEWEVIAKKGLIDPMSKKAKLEDTELSLFAKKRNVKLIAKKAFISFEGNELKLAKLKDGVKVNFNDELNLITNDATYHKKKNTVTTKSPVRIETDFIDVSGNTMKVDVENQVVTIKGNVLSVIHPGNVKKKNKNESLIGFEKEAKALK